METTHQNIQSKDSIPEIITRIYNRYKEDTGKGGVADYIPALSRIDPRRYAVSVAGTDGTEFNIGDYDIRFSIQSISKVFALAMLAPRLGKEIWRYVGKEPSGNAFNSLIQLEYEQGIPRNPFINAGALVITDKLLRFYPDLKHELICFVRSLVNSDAPSYNKLIALSEIATAHRNAALAHLMKSFGNIEHDVDRVIETYCYQCSLSMSTRELAKSFLFLANGGINPADGVQIVSPRSAKRINALMLTCGLYNESGDFAYRVGLPGKSGVGGGIAAVIPGKYSIAVWSPELNRNGNSYRGIATLEDFTTELGESVF